MARCPMVRDPCQTMRNTFHVKLFINGASTLSHAYVHDNGAPPLRGRRLSQIQLFEVLWRQNPLQNALYIQRLGAPGAD